MRKNEQDRKNLTRQVGTHLLKRHSGDHEDPETWLIVAAGMNCRVSSYYYPGGGLGDYAPTLEADGAGVITYNTAATPCKQARVICHELAHHILMPLVPGFVLGDYVICRYEGDPLDERHRIARLVEEFCFRRA